MAAPGAATQWWQASAHFNFEDIGGIDINDDFCALCSRGGELVCCEGPCRRAYHVSCLAAAGVDAAAALQAEAWLCSDCSGTAGSAGTGAGAAAAYVQRLPTRNAGMEALAAQLATVAIAELPPRLACVNDAVAALAALLLQQQQRQHEQATLVRVWHERSAALAGTYRLAVAAPEPLRARLLSLLEQRWAGLLHAVLLLAHS
jgi:hypothetical protein